MAPGRRMSPAEGGRIPRRCPAESSLAPEPALRCGRPEDLHLVHQEVIVGQIRVLERNFSVDVVRSGERSNVPNPLIPNAIEFEATGNTCPLMVTESGGTVNAQLGSLRKSILTVSTMEDGRLRVNEIELTLLQPTRLVSSPNRLVGPNRLSVNSPPPDSSA